MFGGRVGRRREMGLVAAGLVVAVGGVLFMAGAETDDGESDDFSADTSEPFFNPSQRDWGEGMCESMASLKALQTDSAKKADTFAGSPASVASAYLKSASSALEDISRKFAAVDSLTRIPDTERLRASYLREIDRVRPEVSRLSDADGLAGLSTREKSGRAERVTSLVAGIKEPNPSWNQLTHEDQWFETAGNSPGCVAARQAEQAKSGSSQPSEPPEPVPPLPPAADGASLGACLDGACEVRVMKPEADIKVGGLTLDVTRDGSKVTVVHTYPSGGAVRVNLSEEGARGTFGRGGDATGTVTVELKGMNRNGAVLKINSSLPPG
ncbi:hypothetical protein AB0R12_08135 [Streptomyces niveus]|uniref:hypothetical protein n=1 Tax=Streptomyces niveus TaxID=193462 RepID=UPI00341B6306